VSLKRTERNLSFHADALRKLGRLSESEAVAREAADEFAATVRKELINEPAIDFRLQTLQGRSVTLESLRGQAVIITFWATWCVPCREEMPRLEQLYLRRPRGCTRARCSRVGPARPAPAGGTSRAFGLRVRLPGDHDDGDVLSVRPPQHIRQHHVAAHDRQPEV
jgi:hypothetical protein